VYTIGQATAIIESGTPTTQVLQYTVDDPFTIAAGSLVWTAVPGGSGLNAIVSIPLGARAVRGINLLAADTVVVSQSGIL